MAEDIASVSRIALALATGAAFLAAPAGLLAVAAALGLAPRPLIVVALPAFAVFATVSAAIAAALKLYAKSKKNGVAATLKSEPHKKPMSVEEP
ncbi:MAG: hypothetical protein EON54_13080 [Alcaligenaceae bacterium]|nr:MAG: hypothetical protein EON54_13080 [Alcaligenaceae bacterium]